MAPPARRDAPKTAPSDPSPELVAGERLQKVLAAAGIASRRECESLIQEGRVEVDRRVVTQLGTRVDPQRQEIRVDGTPLSRPRHVYYLLNKPAGVVSTNRDPQGRMRVIDLVPSQSRLFTVGRLDRSSEGLILVTNDGELANQLSHPRYGIAKAYHAKVLGFPTVETLNQLRQGIHLADGLARVAALRSRGRHARGAELEIVLTEGRNREIRRILARVGHKVLHLRRTALGPIRLGSLVTGQWRPLSTEEVRSLRAHVTRARAAAERSPRGKPLGRTTRADRKGSNQGRRKGPKRTPTAGDSLKPRGGSTKGAAKTPKTRTVLGYDQAEGAEGGRPKQTRPKQTRPKQTRPKQTRPKQTQKRAKPKDAGRGKQRRARP